MMATPIGTLITKMLRHSRPYTLDVTSQPAQQRTYHRRHAGDRTDQADHAGPFLRPVQHLDAREQLGRHERGERALPDPRRHQHVGVRASAAAAENSVKPATPSTKIRCRP
jgi:hypothetical protein